MHKVTFMFIKNIIVQSELSILSTINILYIKRLQYFLHKNKHFYRLQKYSFN